ncbi:uncharacterized protein LOC114319858 isoform X2 [Camellia sinensis]|nr:uncharacterized protein LOC114319858 isoform X2 [Camellia sinensis]
MAVESAWIFDMDCYYQTLILARRIFVIGGTHMLKKINLTNPNQNEDIKLPSNTKAVKDLYVSPCGKLVLLASMGKKLSITSMGCNKVVISYSFPIRDLIWTCLVIWRADGSSFCVFVHITLYFDYVVNFIFLLVLRGMFGNSPLIFYFC